MKNNLLRHVLLVVGYIVWAVLINALGVWIIGPLVKDLAIYGVLAVVVLAILWLTVSIPNTVAVSLRLPCLAYCLDKGCRHWRSAVLQRRSS